MGSSGSKEKDFDGINQSPGSAQRRKLTKLTASWRKGGKGTKNNNNNNGTGNNNNDTKNKHENRTKQDSYLSNLPSSFHEGLVRERDRKTSFDDIYEVLNEIGNGGLCKIYKVRKYDDKIGGSSRLSNVRHRHPSFRSLQRNLTISFPANNHASFYMHGLHLPPSPGTPGRSTKLSNIHKQQSEPSLTQSERSAMPERELAAESLAPRGAVSERYGNNAIQQQSSNLSDSSHNSDTPSPPTIPRPLVMSERFSTGGAPEMYFALKVINLAMVKEDHIDQLKNEVEILKRLDHQNIIKAYETFQMKKHKKLMIVMELCTGGDLYSRMPYTEKQVASATRQLLSAIDYMHSKNIIHRDIKMENIMWESKHPMAAIKVIDFGLSKRYSPHNNILTERVGTLYSMSPETMKGIYTTQADLWSIGVCTYIMLSIKKPFEGQTPKQLVANVLQCNYSFKTDPPPSEGGDDNNDNTNNKEATHEFEDVWDKISDSAKDFISKLLVLKPWERMTATQAKNHHWFATLLRRCSTSRDSSGDSSHPIGAPLDSEEDESDEGNTGNSYLPTEEFKNKVTQNMVQYADMGEFRRLALNVIAKKSTSHEIFELRQVFDDFDTLNTGTITMEEFKAALARFDFSEDDIVEIFRKIDVNKNNVINYTEFLAAALETQGTIEEYRLAEAFDMLDSDDSGYISRDNLRQLLGSRAKDEKYIDRLIAEADYKKDGKISYDEFLQVFSRERRDEIQTKFYEQMGAKNQQQEQQADEVLQRHGIAPSSPVSSPREVQVPAELAPPLTGVPEVESSKSMASDSSTGSKSRKIGAGTF